MTQHEPNKNNIILFCNTYLRDYEIVGTFETIEKAVKYILEHKLLGKFTITEEIGYFEVAKYDKGE